MRQRFDCVVVGGGPAGLTAAIYLARFHLSVAVFDDGRSRAALIPRTRNHAGYPDGIPGTELLSAMRAQAETFGMRMIGERVEAVSRDGEGFKLAASGGEFAARKVLLATGVINLAPDMTKEAHDDALRRGLLRYCPVCDGYEVTDRNVALLGTGEHGVAEAQFMRSYSARVTLVSPYGPHKLDEAQRQRLLSWGIAAADGPVEEVTPGVKDIVLTTPQGDLAFDTLYPALGTEIRSELARGAGAQTSDDGAVLVDCHQMTSVEGLYAAGDVVKGLDQISAAMGQAAIAATAMRNMICERHPLRR